MPPTAPPTDRIPEPITRFSEADGGSVKIDGAHVSFAAERAKRPKPPATVVPAEIKPGGGQLVVLDGGPADGREARVPRGVDSYSIPASRADVPAKDFAPERIVAGKPLVQTIVGGDYGNAVYLRTDRRDDSGLAVFEFAGVE